MTNLKKILIQEIELYQAILRETERSNFFTFVRRAFEELHPNQKLVTNWHIEYICQIVQDEIERIAEGRKKTKDIIINVPPRSLKSFAVTVCAPAWAWLRFPEMNFFGISYSSSLATEHNMMTRRIVETEWYQRFNPPFAITTDQNTKTDFQNDSFGRRASAGITGTITGKGADIIIIDDPINPKKARSKVERDGAISGFKDTLSTRLNRPELGVFIVIMQRLHEEDLTGFLETEQADSWHKVCLPGELTDKVSPVELREKYTDDLLFPQRFSREVLARLRQNLGSFGYAGQILQQPVPDEGGLFKSAWFDVVTREEFDALPGTKTIHFYADTAYTKKSENDPSAILAACKVGNLLYILDYTSFRAEFHELIKKTEEFAKKAGYGHNSHIKIEPKASGKTIVQAMRKSSRLRVSEFRFPSAFKATLADDKETRATAITADCEAKKVVLLRGAWNNAFLDEVTNFPNAKHDEAIDCLVMSVADSLYRTNNLSFSSV